MYTTDEKEYKDSVSITESQYQFSADLTAIFYA